MSKAMMSEETLQQHVVKLLEAYGRPDIEWHHVPNGGARDRHTAQLMKLAGTKPGVADLMFLIDGLAVAVELKTEIGTQSKDQEAFQERFERAGGKYFIAYGLQQAIGVLSGIKAFRANITLSPTIADDGRGVRSRPWDKKTKAGNQSPSEARTPV